jgi:heme exporter protein C
MLAALYMALAWAPDAANLEAPAERYAQRIFYFHVPSAWVGFLAFIIAAVASLLYLLTRQPKWDIWALASVEIGLVLFTMVLVSGSIWARPTWNVWWTWDPRLTISTISWLLYIGYLMLRGAVDNPERQARFAAVYALVAAMSVPINWMAIRWWRTIHPAVVAPGKNTEALGSFGMSDNILTTLLFCTVAFAVFYLTLMYHRINLEYLKRRVEALKQQVLYQDR